MVSLKAIFFLVLSSFILSEGVFLFHSPLHATEDLCDGEKEQRRKSLPSFLVTKRYITDEEIQKDPLIESYEEHFNIYMSESYADQEQIFMAFFNTFSQEPQLASVLTSFQENLKNDESFLRKGYGFYMFGMHMEHFYNEIHERACLLTKEVPCIKNIEFINILKQNWTQTDADILTFLTFLAKRESYLSYQEYFLQSAQKASDDSA